MTVTVAQISYTVGLGIEGSVLVQGMVDLKLVEECCGDRPTEECLPGQKAWASARLRDLAN